LTKLRVLEDTVDTAGKVSGRLYKAASAAPAKAAP
jgi:hypothetical protein